ncbi:MAG: exosortase A [Pontixanthobacter sp.]
MPLDLPLKVASYDAAVSRIPLHWRQPLVRLALALTALAALTHRDWWAMMDQWWNISTYNHILFVPLIIGWLVYARREELGRLVPDGWWPGLVLLGGALVIWLLGTLAGVNSVSQLGAVLALQAVIIALLGLRIAAASLFPLAYLIFLVPFGEELVPTLQMVTAKLVIILTELSGIPAVIDGVFIDTPVGLFEVAEACSGVKFLIAMIALGVLIAYTCFRSWGRRALFMAGAIVLPILANGVRAWGTIYIAQWQGVEFAQGFDHIFYGWVFFAVVVGALLAVSWRWFDRDPDDIGIDFPQADQNLWFKSLAGYKIGSAKASMSVLAMFGSIAVWNVLAARVEASVPQKIALPEVVGWTRIDYHPVVAWEPKAGGANHRLLGRYRNEAGQQVDVFYALYSAQEDGREASAFGEGAFDPDSDWRWLHQAPSVPHATSDYLLAFGKQKRLVQTTYRVGDLLTGSAVKLKLASMRDRLLLDAQPTMLLIVSAEQTGDTNPEAAVGEFRKSLGDEGEWMDRIAGLR